MNIGGFFLLEIRLRWVQVQRPLKKDNLGGINHGREI